MSCNHLSDCPRCGVIVDDYEERCLSAEAQVERLEDDIIAEHLALKRAMSKRNPYPVEWNKDGKPPCGVEIVYASAHMLGMGVIDEDTPPMPPGMWWCRADEARLALGLEPANTGGKRSDD